MKQNKLHNKIKETKILQPITITKLKELVTTILRIVGDK